MEAWILDKNFEPVSIVDKFKSFLWTDRYNSYGEFELYVPATLEEIARFEIDYYLQIASSDRIMIIESRLVETDPDDGPILKVSGRSLESILKRRIAWGQVTISGNFQNGIKTILEDSIISPSNANRKIENFIFKESIDESITSLELEASYAEDYIYDIIRSNCEEFEIGFRVILNDSKQLEFSLYNGLDRSYFQTTNLAVVFSSKFDNLMNSSCLISKKNYKNVILVGGDGDWPSKTTVTVGEATGLDRREYYEDAGDIDSASSAYTEQLKSRGNEVLTENSQTLAFEGEADMNVMYKYGTDFSIGDIVQFEDDYGNEGRSRITEIVFSQDSSGEYTYPTFESLTKEGAEE